MTDEHKQSRVRVLSDISPLPNLSCYFGLLGFSVVLRSDVWALLQASISLGPEPGRDSHQ